jgi:hypothetical protein
VAAFLWPQPATAQAACGERDKILAALFADHAEVPVARGLATGGVMIEVLAAESGTFTVLLTRPTGVSCLIMAGDFWETLPVDIFRQRMSWSAAL